MDLELVGKTALVTGGSRGIGRAVAVGLAAEGCRLHLAGRTLADLEDAKREILSARAPEVTLHVADLVCFLASARAAYISGTIVTIDGGAVGRARAF